MIPKWSSWVLRPVAESLTSPSQRASWRLRSVRLRAWRAFLPDSSHPKSCRSRYWVNGTADAAALLELQPARPEPDDRHVPVAADRRARGLADRAEPVRDRDARGDLEALAGAGAVGEAVLEGLLEPAQVVGLAERELSLGAAQLDSSPAPADPPRAGAGTLRGRSQATGRGEDGHLACSLTAWEDGRVASAGNRGNRLAPWPGREAVRPATALLFFL